MISRVSKADGATVRTWLNTVDDHQLAICALTIFELAKGIQKIRTKKPELVPQLQASLDDLKQAYEGRIFGVTPDICETWGGLSDQQSNTWIDMGLVAVAAHHGLTLVSLNAAHVKGRGVPVIHPGISPAQKYLPNGVKSP